MTVRRILVAMLVVVAAAIAAYALARHDPSQDEANAADHRDLTSRPRVEAVHPTPGGLKRSTTQPASILSFGMARLFAQVSGYLKTQSVDIGDRVTAGQVLAEIDVPQLEKQRAGNKADVDLSRSKVEQAKARVNTATADVKASEAAQQQSQADVSKAKATLEYRQKAYHRIKELFELHSIEEKLVDEEQEKMDAADASLKSAQAVVVSAGAQIEASKARLQQAQADVGAATSNVEVSQAQLEKTEVLLNYTHLVAPFDGVIAERNYYPGDFVRAADQGESKPLLSIARTDLMRVVVQVPDNDVPFTHQGEDAVVTVSTLPGHVFDGKVSRTSNIEDERTRTMRVEIDLKNDGGLLHGGMYGSATIMLDDKSQAAVTIPSASLNGKVENHEASVYVVRDNKLASAKLKIGHDDGIHVEVLDGLSKDDWVVTQHSGPIGEGAAVDVVEKK